MGSKVAMQVLDWYDYAEYLLTGKRYGNGYRGILRYESELNG